MSELPVIAIFVATYALISAGRLSVLPLGRPGAALLGAVAMVEVGALSPEDAYAAVDGDTIVLLFGMMLVTAHLAEAGFFARVASFAARRAATRRNLLRAIVLVSGSLSALFVNDTVCLLLPPIVLTVCRRAALAPLPYLLAIAMGANVGSVATLTGNPQNMLIGSLSGIGYGEFFLHLLPVALAGLAITTAILERTFAAELAAPLADGADAGEALVDARLMRISLGVSALLAIAFFAGADLAWTALAGGTAILVLARRDPQPVLARVDWSVLLFFAALFIVVAAINRTALPGLLFGLADPWIGESAASRVTVLSAMSLLGSNLVSNVPFILVVEPWLRGLGEPDLLWKTLAMSTTFAGNLTLLGSVANVIVFEIAREECPIGFWRYARVGIPVTLATTAAGIVLLLAGHALGR